MSPDPLPGCGDVRQPNGTRRLSLILEYDGTRYKGFQWQSNVPTIQGELERAIKSLTGETTRVKGASRTDSGAHAKGQVVDFLTSAPYTTDTFSNALNWHLPSDIVVRGAHEVPHGFNSRKDAASRVYLYTVLNSRWPSALLRGYSHWVSSRLDVERMQEASSRLAGVHDFSALAMSLPPGRSPVRRVKRWEVSRQGELVLIESEANGFLPHQIRMTNGILVEVGLGRRPVEAIGDLTGGPPREPRHVPSLPARGLCLVEVKYQKIPWGATDDREAV